MPSKGKKSSKPDRSPISRAPSTPTSARGPESDKDDELHLQRLLSQASAKFPNFINESAFMGRICDQDSDFSKGNQARVWLSESAMVSFSISPGSLVSVIRWSCTPINDEKFEFLVFVVNWECKLSCWVDICCIGVKAILLNQSTSKITLKPKIVKQPTKLFLNQITAL